MQQIGFRSKKKTEKNARYLKFATPQIGFSSVPRKSLPS